MLYLVNIRKIKSIKYTEINKLYIIVKKLIFYFYIYINFYQKKLYSFILRK